MLRKFVWSIFAINWPRVWKQIPDPYLKFLQALQLDLNNAADQADESSSRGPAPKPPFR